MTTDAGRLTVHAEVPEHTDWIQGGLLGETSKISQFILSTIIDTQITNDWLHFKDVCLSSL